MTQSQGCHLRLSFVLYENPVTYIDGSQAVPVSTVVLLFPNKSKDDFFIILTWSPFCGLVCMMRLD